VRNTPPVKLIELEDKNSLRYQVYCSLSQLIAMRRAEKAFHPDSEAYFSHVRNMF
jgi:sucrose phosphorylase